MFDLVSLLVTILIVFNTGVMSCWIYLTFSIVQSFRNSPRLKFDPEHIGPEHRVSIIIPARNEEQYISRCLKSLLRQKHVTYEVIAVNDSSTDNTLNIMRNLSKEDNRLVIVNAPPKPGDWIGKNWACYHGYLNSTGEIFLFTDADTVHSPEALSSALASMLKEKLDAISAVPKLSCKDIITRVTLPILSVFLHSRYSPVRVNDPKTRVGYFFGSFYLIKRTTYESVGTHESVRHELVEDGALGHKVKEMNFKLKLVRGEAYVEAIWARDPRTLWNALRRLIIPLYHNEKRSAILIVVTLFFILLEPIILFPLSAYFIYTASTLLSKSLFLLSLTSLILVVSAGVFQSKYGLLQRAVYGLGSPVGCAIITICFLLSLFDMRGKRTVSWRDRDYEIG
jgi:chlorobactene glucosyltransferase